MLQRITPHLVLLGVLTGLAAIGLAGAPDIIARWLGATAAMMTDPLLLAAAVVLGLFVRRHTVLIASAVSLGIVLSAVISSMQLGVDDAIQVDLALVRALAVVIVAYAVNLVVLLVAPASAAATSTTSWLENPEAQTEASAIRGIRAASRDDQPSKSRPAESTASDRLVFHDACAALEYACRYMNTDVDEGAMLPAVIVDAREHFGTDQTVKVLDSGVQIALLRVASSDGGFLVPAATAGTGGPRLGPGDFVAWQAIEHKSNATEQAGDERTGWIGLIVGTLRPEWHGGQWRGGDRF